MRDICKYIMESDLVVYATPVYWSGPSAQLKLAMDRCVAFLDPQFDSRVRGKKAVTLMCCADEDSEMCRPSLDMFGKTFEGLGMIYAGRVEATGCADKGKVKQEILEAARRVAESVL
jgi:multimeric flavodoxin WrbA